ncbi:MAG: nucleotidyltransferase family protein [Myxococcota bacterium]
MSATAFVLAAGLGTRLRPLTLTTPKPLLPVAGRPMLDHVLDHLRRHGHEEVVVNTFWLADSIVDWARDKPGVTVIVEAPAVLGTGGGLKNAAPHLAERFVIVNGDILSDIDLGALWAVDAPAVMALRPQATPVHTGVALVDGVVRGIGNVVGAGDPALHFTGVHVLHRDVLDLVPPGEQCIIRTAYRALVPEGKVRGVVHTGRWTDIGTLADYEAVKTAGW